MPAKTAQAGLLFQKRLQAFGAQPLFLWARFLASSFNGECRWRIG